jgi:radical SAM superfamily enzyme YgiQ (UPF0313 family)
MRILLLSIIPKERILNEEELGIGAIAAFLEKENIVKVKQIRSNYDIEKLNEFAPELIGVSLYDDYIKIQLEVLSRIAKTMPDSYIVIGGQSAAYNWQEIMMNYSFIHFAVLGEGELPIIDLTRAIKKKSNYNDVGGIVYRKNDEIIQTKKGDLICDLDELPFANRDMLKNIESNIVQITSSRGCLGNCTFCVSPNYWRDENEKRRYRRMSSKRIVDEIEYIINKYNKNRFLFTDNSYEDPDNAIDSQIEVAEEIIKRNLNITYGVNYRVGFYKYANEDFMKTMIRSGLNCIFLGIESFDEKSIAFYNKLSNKKQNELALDYFSKFDDFLVFIGFINLNPYTTINSFKENIEALKKYGFLSDLNKIFSKLRVYKGTKIYEALEKSNLIEGSLLNSGLKFRYIDKKMEEFDRLLFNYAKNMKVYDSTVLCQMFPSTLLHLKREANTIGNVEAIKMINDCKNTFKTESNKINDLVYEWVINVLLLFESNKHAAIHTTDEFIDLFNSRIKKLYQLRNSFLIELIKLDKSFSAKI